MLQRRLWWDVVISGRESVKTTAPTDHRRRGGARRRAVRPASATAVPASSSTSATVPDRRIGRQWRGNAGRGKFAARARTENVSVRCWVDDLQRTQPPVPAEHSDCFPITLPRHRDVITADDDVTVHVGDVGHDRHVAQTARSASAFHPGAVWRL